MGTGVFRVNDENFCAFTERVATIDKLFVAKLYVVKSSNATLVKGLVDIV
jgi:hypothetical protein